METIEERYGNPIEPHCFETDREEQWYQCGEVHGATEQREIDIEKACAWINAMMVHYGIYDAMDREDNLKNFRKALEK